MADLSDVPATLRMLKVAKIPRQAEHVAAVAFSLQNNTWGTIRDEQGEGGRREEKQEDCTPIHSLRRWCRPQRKDAVDRTERV